MKKIVMTVALAAFTMAASAQSLNVSSAFQDMRKGYLNKAKAEIDAARKAKEDAEQAIQKMAEAEGHDPEYIREREERRAKRKEEEKKALDDNLSRIRMEMALSENYALEMDEFEYLV